MQLLHVGPGVMGGDLLSLAIDVERGAQAVVVSQSATKLHAMDDGAHAEQVMRVRVAAGGSLELHPGLTIPFARAAYHQRIEVDLEPGARFVLVERWASGRVARGEQHAYRRAESRLHLRVDGRLVHADALVLEPELAHHHGVFEGHAYLATGVAFGVPGPAPDTPPPARVAEASLALIDLGEHRVALRALGRDGVALQRALTAQVDAWRRADGRSPLALARFGS